MPKEILIDYRERDHLCIRTDQDEWMVIMDDAQTLAADKEIRNQLNEAIEKLLTLLKLRTT